MLVEEVDSVNKVGVLVGGVFVVWGWVLVCGVCFIIVCMFVFENL